MNTKMLSMLILLLFMACKPEPKGVINISVEDLQNKLEDNIQLVDVRTPAEWEEGIIKGASKICVTSDDFESNISKQLDKSKPVYVYCKSGGRSLLAGNILVEKGFKVYNLEGGYLDWKDKSEK